MFRNLFATTAINQERGFLPAYNPSVSLPATSAYNVKLNNIIQNLSTLLKERKLREAVDALNREHTGDELVLEKGNKAQKSLAICMLASIAQAYIFENAEKPVKSIPGAIARNLYQLCKSKQRFPMLTYSDYILNNWRLKDETAGISLDNVEPIVNFTGTTDEAWFIKIHVVIEAVSAAGLAAANKAFLEAGKENPDLELIRNALNEMTQSINQAVDVMHRMKEGCRPDVFWNTVRQYLGGWDKNKFDVNEPGVFFEGIQTRDKKPFAFTGPSGAQSSIVPSLDAVLKIKHEIDGMHKKLLEFKEYMPNQDQAVILQFATSNVKHVVKHGKSAELETAYNESVEAVKKMRGAHLGLVHAYIYQPAGQQGIPREAITGTGGAPIESYLTGRFTNTGKRL